METICTFSPKGHLSSGPGRHMYYIDFAYFLSILLVIWGHSHPLSSVWYDTWYGDLNAFIYSFHMPVFFFIGGYLMVFSQSIDELGLKKWILEKLRKFLVPYLLLTLLAYMPKSVLEGTSDMVELSLEYLLRTTFLIPRKGVWGHFWFIATFLVTEVYWGLWRAAVKKHKAVANTLFAVGVAVCLGLMIFPVYTDYFMLNDIRFHSIFYPCGIVMAMLAPKFWDCKWKNVLGILVPAAAVIPLYPYGNFRINTFPLMNFAVGILLVWCVWSISVLLGRRRCQLVHFVVRDSFTVFIYSWPAQAVMDVVLRHFGVNWLVCLGIMFATGLAFPLLLANFYRRFKVFHCKFFDCLLGLKTTSE